MIDYVDNVWVLLRVEGSVFPEAALQALPSTVFALSLCLLDDWWPVMREKSGWTDLNIVGSIWNAMTLCISILLGLRIKQGWDRFWEGTSLLHQMRGEWFDAASCLITFSRDAKVNGNRKEEVDEFRNTLIRLMSLMHGSALDEISDSDVSYDVIDVAGLDTDTLLFLRDCGLQCTFSKVEALQHLIQVLITANHHSGVLSIPPPILSRVYQTLSRGFVNLLNARKIKDTMFPFPFVQMLKLLLIVHSFFTPVAMTTFLNANFWAVPFTFLPLFGLHCLNIIAWQLEMPFGADSNDLPLLTFQKEMNDTLLMLGSSGSDHCPTTSENAVILTGRRSQVTFSSSRILDDVESSESPRGLNNQLRGSFVNSSNTRSFLDKSFFAARKSVADASIDYQFGSGTNTPVKNGSRSQSVIQDSLSPSSLTSTLTPGKSQNSHHVNILSTIYSIELPSYGEVPLAVTTPRVVGTTPSLTTPTEVTRGAPSRGNDTIASTAKNHAFTPGHSPRSSPRFCTVAQVGLDRPALDDNVGDDARPRDMTQTFIRKT